MPSKSDFRITSPLKPTGDQPRAIEGLSAGLREGAERQILLGVTGSGKTYTMANVIEREQRPALVIAHNKTLAAQLCSEFREFFGENAVEYFVSYYDYYQPEAYVPQTDTYIEKDSSMNDEIDRLRHSATQAVLERRDVVVVASVSCIYGLGSPEEYKKQILSFERGESYRRDDVLRNLIQMQFVRNDMALGRGTFRVRGDTLEIQPADEEIITRVEFFGDEVEKITVLDPVTGELVNSHDRVTIYPATHYVTPAEDLEELLKEIEQEMIERIQFFERHGRLLEAQRLEQRTRYDMEMIREVGYCNGIENYSRIFDRRPPGSAPATLLSYFPDDYLLFIDESHQTIPQIHGMYNGDRARKETLVEYGFRLPSAVDNRPLKFEEFETMMGQTIFVSATPGPYEKRHATRTVEQLIRPTGLVDPEVVMRPTKGQIDDLIAEIRQRIERNERVLVTTLTKKMAEDLSEYLLDLGLKVHYLHSEIETLDRIAILRDLRLGVYDVIVGINLLREGLDLPEVALVAILDADKEGFLRSETSLIQTIGRAARNVQGKVLLYADKMTDSMQRAIDETNRRREVQMQYNQEHGIVPQTIRKAIRDVIESERMGPKTDSAAVENPALSRSRQLRDGKAPLDELMVTVAELEQDMKAAARNLEFEQAALLRDEITRLKKLLPQGALKDAPVTPAARRAAARAPGKK
ncbi:MAG: excinuclease ABC subunit UvrB [Armatimonadetes bacterium]|nr:excinuclease ABC subunit UvrB [Armatimonadota bacterium]